MELLDSRKIAEIHGAMMTLVWKKVLCDKQLNFKLENMRHDDDPFVWLVWIHSVIYIYTFVGKNSMKIYGISQIFQVSVHEVCELQAEDLSGCAAKSGRSVLCGLPSGKQT